MKVLWISNSPVSPSGYGTQTATFTRLLKDAGHEVVVFGFYGHRGAVVNWGGIPILPGSMNEWGNDIIPAHVDHYKPDVSVLLCDAWVYAPEVIRLLTAWAPVDHDPMPPLVRDRLHQAKHVWAMSRFGERQMRQAGIHADYVPHGVDTSVYKPLLRAEARKFWGIEDGTFFAVMVAANKGFPSRKSLDKVIKAWGRFVQTHKDAVLYIHALPGDQVSGLDLQELAAFYGVPPQNLRFVDTYRFVRGDYDGARLNMLYNAADVLLAPSMGEGFGIPVIEAQAAGCPVVVSDFTAQHELAGPGYRIPVDKFDDGEWTLQGSEQARVRPSEILRALEWAFSVRGDATLRAKSVEFAREYDAQKVLQQFMLPALERIASASAADKLAEVERDARTAQRLAMRASARAGVTDAAAD